MDTPVNNLNKEERENVLTVLNEFTEEYKTHSKSVTALTSSIKDLTEKVVWLLERPENPESKNENVSRLEDLIENGVEKIMTVVQKTSLPEKELRELFGKMEKNSEVIKNPPPQKIIHHHHIPKITWIAAGLFIVIALASAGWYMTAGKLEGYTANDTKYRYLKLDTGNAYLQKLLSRTDSLLRKNVSMRDTVINMEEEYHNNFDLLEKANHMNAEAENLKADAKRLKEKAGKK